ncbi:MAG: hypothetical protein ACLFM7_12635 [Bacteroidales bacterium]
MSDEKIITVSSRIEKSEDNFQAVWNEEEKMTDISVDLPQGVYAGESVTINLQASIPSI